MLLPDPVLNPLFVNRYERLLSEFRDITLSEAAVIQDRTDFVAIYPQPLQVLAGVFWEKVLRPIIFAFKEAKQHEEYCKIVQAKFDQAISSFILLVRNSPVSVLEHALIEIKGLEWQLSECTNNLTRATRAVLGFWPQPLLIPPPLTADNKIQHIP